MNSPFGNIKAWLLPIVLIVILLVVFGYYRSTIDTGAPLITQIVEEQTQEKPKKDFAKPKELTVAQKATNDNEGMSIALHSGAISDCEEIKYDDELKQLCEDQINYANAVKANDESGCDLISDAILKELCQNKAYFTMGIESQDPSVCEKITDTGMKANCLDQITAAVAKDSGSIEDCNQIGSDQLKENCTDNVNLKTAATTNDATACDNLSSVSLIEQCKSTVNQNIEVAAASEAAAVSKKTIKSNQELLAICETLDGSQEADCKNTVYPKIALDEKDLSYCDNISDATLAAACKTEQGQAIDEYYLRSSIASKDKGVCENISNTALKEVCLNS